MLKDAEENKKKAIKKISELEDKIKNAKKLREQELKEAEKAMDNLKKALEKSRKVMMEKQQVGICLLVEQNIVGMHT